MITILTQWVLSFEVFYLTIYVMLTLSIWCYFYLKHLLIWFYGICVLMDPFFLGVACMIRFSVQASWLGMLIFICSRLEWSQNGKIQSVQMVANGLSHATERQPLRPCGLKRYIFLILISNVKVIGSSLCISLKIILPEKYLLKDCFWMTIWTCSWWLLLESSLMKLRTSVELLLAPVREEISSHYGLRLPAMKLSRLVLKVALNL